MGMGIPQGIDGYLWVSMGILLNRHSQVWRASGCTPHRVFLGEISPCHTLPPGPIVAGAVSPPVDPVRNGLLAHDLRQSLVLVPAHLVFSGCQNISILTVMVQAPGIADILEVMGRTIEVAVVVIVAVEKLANVESSAHAQAGLHHIRTTKSQIQGVVAAKRTAGGTQVRTRVPFLNQWQDFVKHVLFVLHMACNPPARWNALVVPALTVHTVQTKQLKTAAADLVREGRNHLPVFELKKSSLRCWEHQRRQASMPEHQQLHISLKTRRPPLVIFAIH